MNEALSDADKKKIAELQKKLKDLSDDDAKIKRDKTMTGKAIKNKGVMQASASDKHKWKQDMQDYAINLKHNKEQRAKLRAEVAKAKGKNEGFETLAQTLMSVVESLDATGELEQEEVEAPLELETQPEDLTDDSALGVEIEDDEEYSVDVGEDAAKRLKK